MLLAALAIKNIGAVLKFHTMKYYGYCLPHTKAPPQPRP